MFLNPEGEMITIGKYCQIGGFWRGVENILLKADHGQEAHKFPRVDDRWKSSKRSRWLRGGMNFGFFEIQKKRKPDDSGMNKNGLDQGFLGNQDSFLLLTPVDARKDFQNVDTE